MGTVVVQVIAFVAGAFLLGICVGFMLWRSGRRCVPNREWHQLRRDHARIRSEATELNKRYSQLQTTIADRRSDVTRVTLRLAESERRRIEAASLLESASKDSAELRQKLEEGSQQLLYLRRRITELSILLGVPSAGNPAVDVLPPSPSPTVSHLAKVPVLRPGAGGSKENGVEAPPGGNITALVAESVASAL